LFFVGLDSTNILRGRRRTRPVASDPDDNAPTVRVEWYVWGVDRARHGHVRTGVAAPAVVGALPASYAAKSPKTEFRATVGALSYRPRAGSGRSRHRAADPRHEWGGMGLRGGESVDTPAEFG
jgi:hypothetical protein